MLIRARCETMRLFFVWPSILIVLLLGFPAHSLVVLTAPKRISALAEDVSVTVVGARNGDVVFLRYENESTPLTAQVITQTAQIKDIPLAFDCGYFWRIGVYFVELLNRTSGNITSRATIHVHKFPNVRLKTKRFHESYTTDVKVIVSYNETVCRSRVVSQYRTELRITANNTERSSIEVPFPPESGIFPCQAFSDPGPYTVALVVSRNGYSVTVADSRPINIEWSSEYDIELDRKSFPSTRAKSFVVRLSRPPCVPEQDSVEVVAMFTNGTDLVVARQVIMRSDQVEFESRTILERSQNAPGLCFRYVTSDVVIRTKCLPIRGRKGFIVNGSWTAWSQWTSCQRLCSSAVQRRKRSCNNPAPHGNGSNCNRDSLNTIERQFRNKTETTFKHCLGHTLPGNSTATVDCTCGCFLYATELPRTLISPLPGQCQSSNEIVWKVFAGLIGRVIRFHVIDLQVGYDDVISISDANRTAVVTHRNQTFTSNYYAATVTFAMSMSYALSEPCGFTILYRAVDRSEVFTAVPEIRNNSTQPSDSAVNLWISSLVKNPVLFGAIGGCAVIIFIVSLVILRHACRQKNAGQNNNKESAELRCRLTTPPDGKSCSNIDTESDRVPPVGEQMRTCTVERPTTPRPKAAYYLAQRQLQLMKQHGHDNSSQMYNSSCLDTDTLREQEELLFGTLNTKSTPGET